MSISKQEWRENTVEAAEKFRDEREEEESRGGTRRLLDTIRSRKPVWTEENAEALSAFFDLLIENDYYSAGLMADTVLADAPQDFDEYAGKMAVDLLNERGKESGPRVLKEAFSILDSFDSMKEVDEISDESWYLDEDGPERLIDRVATDVWRGLEGSSRAFFEKYVEEESEATIYPEEGMKLEENSYIEAASIAFDQRLEEDPFDAANIAKRFDLDEEKLKEAQDRQRVKRAARTLQESSESSRKRSDSFGNFLTDRYLWQTNPEKAQEAGDESLAERVNLMYQGRRSAEPSEERKMEIFREFLDDRRFHTASLYAETARLDVEDELEDVVIGLMEDNEFEYAFAAMDEFDYTKFRDEIDRDSSYLEDEGPDRLIDWVATTLWQDLDGSARAFFQMYIDDPDERPENSFDGQTVANTYIPGSEKPRSGDSYRDDAFYAYEQAFEESIGPARQIEDRFDLKW